MSGTICPKNWASFQHYKDRKPAWIKLHRDLLDNYDFACLPVASRALAPCLWLLASEYEGGKIPADWAMIAFRLRMSEADVETAITPLIDKGFFIASSPLARRYQDAIPEKEKEREKEVEKEVEKRGSKDPSSFAEKFWRNYPHKVGRRDAEKAYHAALKRGATVTDILAGLERYKATKPHDRPWCNPSTFLNHDRWLDQPATDTRESHDLRSALAQFGQPDDERPTIDVVPLRLV